MKITPITQHRQGETAEDREDRDRLNRRVSEVDTTFKKLD